MSEPHTSGHEESGSDSVGPAVENGEILDPHGPCMACGAPNARIYGSADGPARLCPPCATLDGLGCP